MSLLNKIEREYKNLKPNIKVCLNQVAFNGYGHLRRGEYCYEFLYCPLQKEAEKGKVMKLCNHSEYILELRGE